MTDCGKMAELSDAYQEALSAYHTAVEKARVETMKAFMAELHANTALHKERDRLKWTWEDYSDWRRNTGRL